MPVVLSGVSGTSGDSGWDNDTKDPDKVKLISFMSLDLFCQLLIQKGQRSDRIQCDVRVGTHCQREEHIFSLFEVFWEQKLARINIHLC